MTPRNRNVSLGLLAAGLLLLAGTANASWLTWGGDPNHQLSTLQALPAPLGVEWKFAAAPPRSKAGSSGMVIDGKTLYFGSDNAVYAIDAESGELKWRQPEANSPAAGTNPSITATPAVGLGMVFVPDAEGNVTAYDANDGSTRWAFRARKAVRSSPLLIGKTLYFGSDDDNFYALNATNGDLATKPVNLGEDISMPPAWSNGLLFVSSQAMQLWCLRDDTLTTKWGGRVLGTTANIAPVISGGKVFLANGSTMTTFRAGNGGGRPFPLSEMRADIGVTPIITENNWYVTDKNGVLYNFDHTGRLVSNAVQWPEQKASDVRSLGPGVQLDGHPGGPGVITAADASGHQELYVSTDKGFIYGINALTGKMDWVYRCRPPASSGRAYFAIRAPLVVDGRRLYSLGEDGILTCFSPEAMDADEPVVTLPKPGPGGAVNGAPPIAFSVYLWDEGSGINPNTIQVTIDGNDVPQDENRYDSKLSVKRKGFVYDPVSQKLSWTFQSDADEATGATGAEKRLVPGRHEIAVLATDYKGNAKELKWTITADPSLPRPSVVAQS